MSDTPVLTCTDVTKRYRRVTALDAVSLTVLPGQVFGLLGPNGAGKTTLLRIILGLTLPDRGSIELFGRDLFAAGPRARQDVGAVVEAPVFYPDLTAEQNLAGLVSLSAPTSRERIREALDAVGLGDAATARVKTFSYGMKQRLGIAQALLPRTSFLILDEPTNGLDPHGIAGMRELVRRLAHERGITILLSSHLLSEAEQVCDEVAILHHGRAVLQKPVADLRHDAALVAVEVVDSGADLPPIPEQLKLDEYRPGPLPGTRLLHFRATAEETPDIVNALVAAGLQIRRVEPQRDTLEDVFLRSTPRDENDLRIDAF